MPTYNQAPGQVQTGMLGTPTPPPGNQAPNSYNPWETYDTTTPKATDEFAADAGAGEGTADVSTIDLNRVASNVGGIVQETQDAKDWKTFVPEEKDPIEEEVNDFVDADQGVDGKNYTKTNWLGNEVEATGRSAARSAKRQDRRDDRQARKDAGLKGKEKRQARRAQRGNRKASWSEYKGEMDLKTQDQVAELEADITKE
tara:strand:+ start:570 stop:1169 length:600 start_codon:yes stop_codon:yes gene_type:complete